MFTQIDQIINSQTVSGEAFFVVNNQGTCGIYRVNLEPGAEAELTKSFCNSLREKVVTPTSGAGSIPLVSSLISRGKQVYEYDYQTINHLPDELSKMSDVLSFGVNNTPRNFDFSQQSMADVKGIIYHVCDSVNSVVVYQHKYPVSLHKKTKLSYISINGRTLDEVKYDVIDINGNVDFFFLNQKYYALNIDLLERFYGLEQVINNLASNATPAVINLNLIDVSGLPNPLDIFKDMHKDRSFMRRLASISNSPLITQPGGVTMQMVQNVMQQFPIFSRTININSNGLISLTSKENKKNFIRLLNNEASIAALNQEIFLAVGKDSAI